MNYLIGIDPGASGAIAVCDADTGEFLAVHDMPTRKVPYGPILKRKKQPTRTRVDAAKLAAVLRPYATHGAVAALETVGARPGNGAASIFAFGQAHGIVVGVLAALGIRTVGVLPQCWTQWAECGDDKNVHRARAAELFPPAATQLQLVKHDGRADALLIAAYAQCVQAATLDEVA